MASDLTIELLDWQKKVWADDTRFRVVAAGRRCGKSRLAAWLLIINALQADKPNSHVFYVAPTQGQARDIMWSLLIELGHAVIRSSHINNMQITLINGATISLKGADRPDTMRGVSLKFLCLDEYADMKPEVFEEILRPALADQKGSCLFIGTPKGRNHFYDLYKYAELSGDDDDTFSAWHFTSYDNETLDSEEIDVAKKSMSTHAFQQEFMASFKNQGSEMFKEEWLNFGTKPEGDGDYYIAIDLAGFQDVSKKKGKTSRLDNSAISIVFVNESGWFIEDVIYGRWTLDETATKIFQAVRDYKPLSVGIEKGISKQAVMSPIMDMMKRQNFYFRVEELTHGNQKKTDRIMWALQGRFEHGRITLNKKKKEWHSRFCDELFQFPDPLTHDDLIDSLAYIDQLAKVTYAGNFEELDNFETLDSISGY
jgi:predicted phage terminase large subunit-like protein